MNKDMDHYVSLVRTFEEKGCRLLTTPDVVEERRNEKKKNTCHIKVEFIATCGHENTVTVTNFVSKGSGLKCKACKLKDVCEKLKEYQSTIEPGFSRSVMQENDVYKFFLPFLDKHLEVVKTNEGCLADFIVKPKDFQENKWLMIQLKTTFENKFNLYSFKLNKSNYTDNIILCHCVSEDKTWVIPYNEIKARQSISIGKNSIYNKYLCDTANLHECLSEHYKHTALYSLEHCLRPKNFYQQREQEYKVKRLQLAFLPFCLPVYDQCPHDFLIFDQKVQEKVAYKRKDRENQYISHIYANGSGRSYKPYMQGMNAFYWIHIPDTEFFYIIPEEELINRKFIQTNTYTPKKMPELSLNIQQNCDWY